MEEKKQVEALVMSHGEIGAELVKVVEMIFGPVSGLQAISNHGKSADDLTAEVKAWLTRHPKGPGAGCVIFIDDYGGSCANAAQIACRQEPGRAIVSGVNLAMLLGFVTWRDSQDFDELVSRVVQKGREAITLVGGAG